MTDEPSPLITTNAGHAFLTSVTDWLQDVRFAGEAIYRLSKEYNTAKTVDFTPDAWPPPDGKVWGNEFVVREPALSRVVARALRVHWETRFVS